MLYLVTFKGLRGEGKIVASDFSFILGTIIKTEPVRYIGKIFVGWDDADKEIIQNVYETEECVFIDVWGNPIKGEHEIL